MNKAVFALALVVAMLILAGLTMFAPKAHAQGFVDEPTCYSWEGGHKSSGSFSKCTQGWVQPAKVAAAQPAPAVVPPPVMQSNVCPPQIILEPEPKKAVKRKPRPAPLKC